MAELTAPTLPTAPVNSYYLPLFVRTKTQVRELIQEILGIEDFLYKAQVRETGAKMSLPKTTPDLDKLAEANKMNVLNHQQRMELAKYLRSVYIQAPVINVYFSVSENPRFIEGVLSWFRKEVSPVALIELNSHSKVGAGCIIRIKHKTYDFSLKKRFDDNYHVLQEALRAPGVPVATATTERGKYF